MAELDDKVIVTKQKITDIADQIRAELSETDEYKLDVMPTKIHEVAQGGGGGGGEPYIPKEQIICDFDFSEAGYDLVRSIVAETPIDSLLLYPQLYNSSYDSTNGIVTFRNQYSMLNPMVSFEAYADYEIEIKYGDIDNQSGSYDRQLIYFTDTILLWYDGHSGRDYLYVENSSSTIVFNDLNLSSLANKTLKLFIDYSKNQVGDVIATASMQIEGENQKRVLGQIDYNRLNNDLIIGRWSSDEGLYNVDIRSVKVIKKTLKEIPDDIIQPITITENGTYPADGNTVAGYSPIIVNVSEPTTKVVSEFDFSEAEYDLIRSMPNDDPSLNATIKGYTYNSSYDDVNDEISWVNGYGCWSPNLWCNPFKNYDIEVDLGTFDSTTQLAGTKQVIALTKDGTNGLHLVWNTSNGYFQIINDSGTTNLTNYNDLSILNNAKILIKTRWSVSTINYEPICNVTIILDRDSSQSEEISFGRLDNNYAYELRVGRVTSQNGIYPYSVKKCKITESKWILEAPVSLMSASSSESKSSSESDEKTEENPVEKETIEEKADEVKEQKKDSVEKASELDA